MFLCNFLTPMFWFGSLVMESQRFFTYEKHYKKTQKTEPCQPDSQTSSATNRRPSNIRPRIWFCRSNYIQKRSQTLFPRFQFGPKSSRRVRNCQRQRLRDFFHQQNGLSGDNRPNFLFRRMGGNCRVEPRYSRRLSIRPQTWLSSFCKAEQQKRRGRRSEGP